MPDLTLTDSDPEQTIAPIFALNPGAGAGGSPNQFELHDEIGRGGMGVVYLARDLALGREVAVKLLQDKYAPDSSTSRRFVDEARITAQLQHPGIPAVYQVGRWDDGRPYLAMKLIRGRTLDQFLAAGTGVDVLPVFEAICHAVGYAHAQRVIHRDLKPANVMLGAFNEVQVMDWGLAKGLGPPAARSATDVPPVAHATDPDGTLAVEGVSKGDSTTRTVFGSVLGTPAYMAPEQASGDTDRITERSDVFGLGGILCALLTGHPPHAGTTAEGVRLAAANGDTAAAFSRLDASTAGPEVVALCKRCLTFDPAGRPADGIAVAEAVAQIRRSADERAKAAERDRLSAEVRAGESRKRRRVVAWAGGVAVAVLLAGVTGTTLGLIRADGERRAAEKARDDEAAAREEAESSEAVAVAAVRSFDPSAADARWRSQMAFGPTRRVAELERVAERFADQPQHEARTREMLGVLSLQEQDHELAIRQHERAVSLYTAASGPDSPDTLRARQQLAVALYCGQSGDLNRLPEAKRISREVLAARRRVLPSEHNDTTESIAFLVSILDPEDGAEELIELAREALAVRELTRETQPRELVRALDQLTAAYAKCKRWDEYAVASDRLLEVYRTVLGRTHMQTRQRTNQVARLLASAKRHADALRHFDELITVARLEPGIEPVEPYLNWKAAMLTELKRDRDSLPVYDEWLAAIATWSPSARGSNAADVMGKRFRAAQRLNDVGECLSTVEKYEALPPDSSQRMFDAACWRAAVCGLLAANGMGDMANGEADRAMGWLTKAVAAGYNDRKVLTTITDLAPIRDRADFNKLVAGLREKRPPQPAPEK